MRIAVLWVVALAGFMLVACDGAGIETVNKPEEGGERTLLQIIDGVKVWRIYDGGRAIYITTPTGDTRWSERCGKNCQRPTGVNGVGDRGETP